jgi:hypothetical protein
LPCPVEQGNPHLHENEGLILGEQRLGKDIAVFSMDHKAVGWLRSNVDGANRRSYVFKVKAAWGHVGSWFDLSIRQRQNPPPYESPDIWIDSEENSWGVYEHHDANLNPDVTGNPVLNGDRPWIGRVNRVYARVCNQGDMALDNVRFAGIVFPE